MTEVNPGVIVKTVTAHHWGVTEPNSDSFTYFEEDDDEALEKVQEIQRDYGGQIIRIDMTIAYFDNEPNDHELRAEG